MLQEASIEFEFRRRGALSADDLGSALKISQPTVSRLLSRLNKQIIRLGRGRSTKYALLRKISVDGSSWPIFSIDQSGKPVRIGFLHALENRQWCLQQENPWPSLTGQDFSLGVFPDLPWFLDDLRPQGFLGRVFVQTYNRALGFPLNLNQWTADNAMSALLRYGSDLPGSFVIGEAMLAEVLNRTLTPPEFINNFDRAQLYPKFADAMLSGEWPGSSAAGDQPKFTARIFNDHTIRHVIVKFSGRLGRPEDQRWSDLLRSEHLAAVLLSENGIAAAKTDIIESDGRVFLESERFDRIGENGRRCMVSLASVDGAFFGDPFTTWAAAAKRLEAERMLSKQDADRLITLWWFGNFIGNTDMHYGNASLFLDPNIPLSLTPSYDMLPMFYRPNSEGQLPANPIAANPPILESFDLWKKAAYLAEIFWERVSLDQSVSESFKIIAAKNREIVMRHIKQFS